MIYYMLMVLSIFLYYMFPHINSGCLYVTDKVQKIQKIKSIVAKDKSYYDLFIMGFSTVLSAFYMIFVSRIQTFINSFCMKEVSKNVFEIQLFVRNRLIKFRVKIKRGPSDILQVLDKENKDITKDVEPYVSFIIKDVSVKDLGYNEFDIYTSDGDVKSLTEDNKIII